MSKNIIIRCRANNSTGFGHLVRSRVLGKILLALDYKVIFLGPSKKYMEESDNIFFWKWIEKEEWGNSIDEAKYHIELANKYNVEYIIMDDYRSDYEHQLLLRKAKLKVLQQYDASKSQKFAAQLVVNGSPYEKRALYQDKLYRDDIITLHGPKYAVLRAEFQDDTLKKVQKKNKILVTFGGGDDCGAIEYTINELVDSLPSKWEIAIVISSFHPNIDNITKIIQKNKYTNITLLVNPSNMPLVIAECKIAILSGGTTTFEAAYLGVVGILMPIAKNQYNQGIGWSELGAMIYLKPFSKIKEGELKQSLLELVLNEKKINNMANIGRAYVDGLGAQRLIRNLLSI